MAEAFCFGGAPTMADCCLIPQLYNAHRFHFNLSNFLELVAIEAQCAELEAFVDAAPERQPDADGARA